MRAVILASGFATRLHPLTENQSKALLPVKGKPLLTNVVEMIPEDIPIIVTTNKAFEDDFRAWNENERVTLEVEEIYSIKDCPGPIGSLDNVIKKYQIAEPILVLSCDNYFTRSLAHFIAQFNGHDVLIAACYVDNLEEASFHGIPTIDDKGKVTDFVEKPTPSPDTLVAPMCYIFPTRIFPIISNKDIMERAPQGKMPRAGDFIAHLVNIGESVRAYRFAERWRHLTTIESYHKLSGGEQ
ncbi:MAG: NDP-sugar synthase [Chloroflexi bacterium]|nr:NDP-sugar synthase [Chloroflexota bacterium]